MKKILFVLTLLCTLAANAQNEKPRYVTVQGETGIVRGDFQINGALLVASDTTSIPPSIDGRQAIAGKGDSLYRYSYVQRRWFLLPSKAIPDDKKLIAQTSGGNVNNAQIGLATLIVPQYAGLRIRLYRNYLLQEDMGSESTLSLLHFSYAYNIATGTITLSPSIGEEEVFQIQPY